MFGTQIRIGSRMLNCIHIFRSCALPPSGPDRAQRQQSKLITPKLSLLHSWCQIGPGVKLTLLHSWCQIGPVSNWCRCQIDSFTLLVSNWYRCQIDSFTLLVSNCPPHTLGVKLTPVSNWCRCQIVLQPLKYGLWNINVPSLHIIMCLHSPYYALSGIACILKKI